MPVPIERKIAEINGLKFHFARIDGSLDDAGRRKRVKEFWEDGDHRDLHNNPSIASISIRFSSTLTAVTTAFT